MIGSASFEKSEYLICVNVILILISIEDLIQEIFGLQKEIDEFFWTLLR